MVKNKFGVTTSQLKILTNLLSKHFDSNEIFLFGSRVNGNFRSDSDFDIAIINGFETSQENDFRADLESSLFLYNIDLIDYTTITNPKLKQNIDEQKTSLIN